ncbi:MAG: hypothetical protein ACOY0S_03220 [Patescibacteria group bacterium]
MAIPLETRTSADLGIIRSVAGLPLAQLDMAHLAPLREIKRGKLLFSNELWPVAANPLTWAEFGPDQLAFLAQKDGKIEMGLSRSPWVTVPQVTAITEAQSGVVLLADQVATRYKNLPLQLFDGRFITLLLPQSVERMFLAAVTQKVADLPPGIYYGQR